DFVPDEGVGQGGLAGFDDLVDRGKNDVGHDSVALGGGAVGEVEFLDGELGGPRLFAAAGETLVEVAHFDDGLDGALAMGGAVAEHDGAAVVLEGAGNDLRGGGAEPGNEHGEGA